MIDCCEEMCRSIAQGEFEFYPQYRGVCYYIHTKQDDSYGQRFFGYCPYCGKRMPKLLYGIDENGNRPYDDALEEAVGKEFCDITEDEIPEEFKTDEWWKRRGL